MRNAPAMHGNDHIPGGPDPIPGIIGTSYLFAFTDNVAPTASGATPINWPLIFNEGGGTDLEIDVGDPSKINILTNGFYEFVTNGLFIEITSASCVGLIRYWRSGLGGVFFGGDGQGFFGNAAEDANFGIFRGGGVSKAWMDPGEYVQIRVAVITSDASNWTPAGSGIPGVQVTRLA